MRNRQSETPDWQKKRKIHTVRGVQERKDEFAVVAPTKRGGPVRSMAAFFASDAILARAILYIASCRYCCAPTELRARIYGADKRKKTSLDFGSRLDCPDREKWAFYFLEKRNHCHCLGNN